MMIQKLEEHFSWSSFMISALSTSPFTSVTESLFGSSELTSMPWFRLLIV